MKTYEQLTAQEQEWAVNKTTSDLLGLIVEGAIRFDDEKNEDDLQARIDAGIQQADDLQTPWFAGECIMEFAGDDIRSMAQVDAEDALYSENGEMIIAGVAGKHLE